MLEQLKKEFARQAIAEYDTGRNNFNRHQIKIKGTADDFADICKRYGLNGQPIYNYGTKIGNYAKGDGFSIINYFALSNDICLSIAND